MLIVPVLCSLRELRTCAGDASSPPFVVSVVSSPCPSLPPSSPSPSTDELRASPATMSPKRDTPPPSLWHPNAPVSPQEDVTREKSPLLSSPYWRPPGAPSRDTKASPALNQRCVHSENANGNVRMSGQPPPTPKPKAPSPKCEFSRIPPAPR